MFAAYRQRQPGASLWHLIHWSLFASTLWLWLKVCYRYRRQGLERVPRTGSVLFVANHQSFLDLAMAGAGPRCRHFYTFARASLYRSRAFRWFIAPYNAIPLQRGVSDIKALRRGIDLLLADQGLWIFPEGTRSDDVVVGPFLPGMMLMLRKARPTVVPVAIDGTFEAWPRTRTLPRPFGRVTMEFGTPIPPQVLLDMGTEAALEHLRQTVESMRRALEQRRRGRREHGYSRRR